MNYCHLLVECMVSVWKIILLEINLLLRSNVVSWSKLFKILDVKL